MTSLRILTLFILVFSALPAFAQIDTSEQNISEAKAILKDIQKENNFRRGTVNLRVGMMQLAANKAESPLKLNGSDQLPYVEFSGDTIFKKNWGLAYTFQHAQNVLGTSGGVNTTSSYQQVYQFGPVYKYIMDETNIKNFLTFKLQYYMMKNNFKLTNTQLIYATQESGILLGVERSIPATELIDLQGGFDVVFINKIKSDSSLPCENKGNGLQFHADILYAYAKTKRFGLGYTISAFFNKFREPGFEARDRHTQTYKALNLTYSYLF